MNEPYCPSATMARNSLGKAVILEHKLSYYTKQYARVRSCTRKKCLCKERLDEATAAFVAARMSG